MAYNEFAQEITSSVSAKNIAELHITSPAATTIAGAGTYYKVAGTTNADEMSGFSTSGNNRVICDDLVSKKYIVFINISAFVSTGSVVATFGVNKNGIVDTDSVMSSVIGSASNIQSTSIQLIMTLVKDDYVEVVLTNNTNTNSITVSKMNLLLTEYKNA